MALSVELVMMEYTIRCDVESVAEDNSEDSDREDGKCPPFLSSCILASSNKDAGREAPSDDRIKSAVARQYACLVDQRGVTLLFQDQVKQSSQVAVVQ